MFYTTLIKTFYTKSSVVGIDLRIILILFSMVFIPGFRALLTPAYTLVPMIPFRKKMLNLHKLIFTKIRVYSD